MTTSNNNLTAFVLGALAGGTTALLFAPMSGERLRERISERGDELKTRSTETARNAAEKAQEAMEGARATARQKVAAVGEAVDEGKAAYRREMKKAKAS